MSASKHIDSLSISALPGMLSCKPRLSAVGKLPVRMAGSLRTMSRVSGCLTGDLVVVSAEHLGGVAHSGWPDAAAVDCFSGGVAHSGWPDAAAALHSFSGDVDDIFTTSLGTACPWSVILLTSSGRLAGKGLTEN